MRDTLHAEVARRRPSRWRGLRQRPAPGLARHAGRAPRYACGPCRGAWPRPRPRRPRAGRGAASTTPPGRASPPKVERAHHRLHATRAAARRDLSGRVGGFSDARRLHSAPGRRSPAAAERMAARPRPPKPGRDRPSRPTRSRLDARSRSQAIGGPRRRPRGRRRGRRRDRGRCPGRRRGSLPPFSSRSDLVEDASPSPIRAQPPPPGLHDPA